MDSRESSPPRCFVGTGTPTTGSVVPAAIMPGRWAAPPAPATITFRPRPAAARAESAIASGVRSAERTRASEGTPKSRRTAAATSITGQSLSLPMAMPTSGWSVVRRPWSVRLESGMVGWGYLRKLLTTDHGHLQPDQRRGVLGAGAGGLGVVGGDGDVAHLPARADGRLAVEVDGGAGHGEGALEPAHDGRAVGVAEDVDHARGGHPQAGVAERPAEHGADVVLELRRVARLDGVVPRVVRARRQLVDEDAAVGELEQLGRHEPHAADGLDGRQPHAARLGVHRRRQPGRQHDGVAAVLALL